jgi:hypothetical protein
MQRKIKKAATTQTVIPAQPQSPTAQDATTVGNATTKDKTYPPPNAASNTVPYLPNQKLHDEAVALLKQDAKEKVAIHELREKRETYNEKRKAITAKLRPVLEAIEGKFQVGETVGGQSTIKGWCKKYGGITYRRFHQIVTGETQKPKVKSSISLHVGDIVKIDGQEFTLTESHIGFICGDHPLAPPPTPPPTAPKGPVLHIEEKWSSTNRALCGMPLEFIGDGNESNMVKKAKATCQKCIEISDARVKQAAETRTMNKRLKQRLAEDIAAKEKAGGECDLCDRPLTNGECSFHPTTLDDGCAAGGVL